MRCIVQASQEVWKQAKWRGGTQGTPCAVGAPNFPFHCENEGKLKLWYWLKHQPSQKEKSLSGTWGGGPTTPSSSGKDNRGELSLRKHSCGNTTTAQILDEAQLLHGRTQKLKWRQKSTLNYPQDPKFKNRFGSINQDLFCNSKCWCTWASVGDSKLRSWTRNKSCIWCSRDVQLQCVTSRCPQLCHWVLKTFKITFSFQKLFKHTLFIYIGSRVLIYT